MWKMRLKPVFIMGCWVTATWFEGFSAIPSGGLALRSLIFVGAPIWWSGWWKILLGNSWVEELGKWWKCSWDTIEIFWKWTWSLTFGLWKIGDGKFFLDPSGDLRWSLQGELSCQDVASCEFKPATGPRPRESLSRKVMHGNPSCDFWPNFELNRVPCLFVFICVYLGLFAQISPCFGFLDFCFFLWETSVTSPRTERAQAPAPKFRSWGAANLEDCLEGDRRALEERPGRFFPQRKEMASRVTYPT